MNIQLKVMFWLLIKHFICDFPLQATPWMYKNKGTYLHPGGIAHAGIHLVGTFMVLAFVTPAPVAMTFAIFDFLIHYHIDFFKVTICNASDLKPDNSEWFWVLLGLDQLAHCMTYIFISQVVK